MTTEDYLTQLQQDREDLVDNLETQGITGLTGDETFTELVPEVLNISGGGGADLNEYFVTEITENVTTMASWDLIKKKPDLVIADNVTQVSYLFDKDYFFVNGKNNQKILPKVICNSNVTDISYMYASNGRDSNLLEVDLSGINTSNVTNMGYMFSYRSALTTLNLSNFDFSKVEKVTHMFEYCSGLLNLDLSNFIGQSLKVSNFALNSVFYMCNNIKKIDLSNLAPTGAMDTRNMFSNCYKLEEIYLDSYDFGTYGTSYNDGMFANCGSQLTDGKVTKVYVKDLASQTWILNLNASRRPSTWTTDNIIIAGSEADLRGVE